MEEDYYRILEIPSDATEKEVKRAYHRLARERHPDKASTPEQGRRLQEEFALISTAYNVLKDKEKRAEYDSRRGKTANRAGEVASSRRGGVPGASSSVPGDTAARARVTSARDRAAIAQRAYAKGLQLYNAGDYIRAIDFFEAAVKNNEEEAIYHSRLGTALMRSRKGFSRAVSAIQRAIELDPYSVEHRLALGEAYEMVGSTSLAVRAYQELLKWDSGNSRALARLEALGAGVNPTILDRIKRAIRRQ